MASENDNQLETKIHSSSSLNVKEQIVQKIQGFK
jgi:hypothetical protein